MNLTRFLRKCLTDRPAAWRSLKLVARHFRGRIHWALWPSAPLRYRLPGGCELKLERSHSFTHCFWPAVDAYEPDVLAAVQHFLKPGSVFVDCGSNIGYFSLVASSIVGPTGRVLAIEANPVTFRLLERNLVKGGNVTAINCALSSTPGNIELFMPKSGGDVYSSLRRGGLVGDSETESFLVSSQTLDAVIHSQELSRVALVKMDIEGAELDVLRSASNLMQSLRPVILCEYGTNTWPAFGASAEDLLALLRERNYAVGLFDPSTRTITSTSSDTWSRPYVNLVLTPCGE